MFLCRQFNETRAFPLFCLGGGLPHLPVNLTLAPPQKGGLANTDEASWEEEEEEEASKKSRLMSSKPLSSSSFFLAPI